MVVFFSCGSNVSKVESLTTHTPLVKPDRAMSASLLPATNRVMPHSLKMSCIAAGISPIDSPALPATRNTPSSETVTVFLPRNPINAL